LICLWERLSSREKSTDKKSRLESRSHKQKKYKFLGRLLAAMTRLKTYA